MAPHSSILAWKIPWMGKPGRLQSMGWLSLIRLSDVIFTFHFSLSCIGEGNGNPLQCSCLENPRDGGAWWAAICGVGHNWSDLAAYINYKKSNLLCINYKKSSPSPICTIEIISTIQPSIKRKFSLKVLYIIYISYLHNPLLCLLYLNFFINIWEGIKTPWISVFL